MNISAHSKTYLLACAISLVGAGAAWPAEPTADGQQQARRLLNGTRDEPSRLSSHLAFPPASVSHTDFRDAPDQARRMILGLPPGNGAVSRVVDRHGYGDAQKLARQMILGGAAAAASVTTPAGRRRCDSPNVSMRLAK